MLKLVLLLFVIIGGCAPKVNYSFTLPIAITYDEERMVKNSYPVIPVHIERLDESN